MCVQSHLAPVMFPKAYHVEDLHARPAHEFEVPEQRRIGELDVPSRASRT